MNRPLDDFIQEKENIIIKSKFTPHIFRDKFTESVAHADDLYKKAIHDRQELDKAADTIIKDAHHVEDFIRHPPWYVRIAEGLAAGHAARQMMTDQRPRIGFNPYRQLPQDETGNVISSVAPDNYLD